MSSIAITPTRTISYFENAMRSQLETQESEMRDQLKEREAEMGEVQAKNITNNRIVEELRPLCEELPDCALDPVTYEPMRTPLVMRCSHSLSSETAVSVAKSMGLAKDDMIPCPVCRTETRGYFFLYDQSFDETVEHLEKVTKIFKKTVKNNEAQPKKKAAALEPENAKKRYKKRKCSLR